MSRASQADAARHRQQIIEATASLLQAQPSADLTVQQIMSSVGLTHGGFYKHFRSKEELVGLAAGEAFADVLALLEDLAAQVHDPRQSRTDLVTSYLTTAHRDHVVASCANAALAADTARSAEKSPLRESYAAGVDHTLARLAEVMVPGQSRSTEARQLAISTLSLLVGALTLARATAGNALSEEFLGAAKPLLIDD